MTRCSAVELLQSSDPLSDDACGGLVQYSEEDDRVDFKASFDPSAERSWIELAIDCAAFANTEGGFIVVGVRDQTWEAVGITSEAATALRDTKKVLEKVNRGDLRPPITRARTRVFTMGDRDFAVVYIPASTSLTHIFESNRDWTAPSGKSVPLISKGAIYVRRSASNQVLTSADFEALLARRIAHFRERILDGVVRVVNAAPETQVVTVAKVVGVRGQSDLQVVDAPPGSELVGRSLTFTAKTLADKINLYSALLNLADNERVDAKILFEAFAVRHDQDLVPEHSEWVAVHSLLRHAPVFYWLRGLRTADARRLIEAAFNAGTSIQRSFILNYAAFYGDSFHRKLYDRVPPHTARPLRTKQAVFGMGPSRYRTEDERQATELAVRLSQEGDKMAEYQLEKLDCGLYAPF